jgi:hypothetical protein
VEPGLHEEQGESKAKNGHVGSWLEAIGDRRAAVRRPLADGSPSYRRCVANRATIGA